MSKPWAQRYTDLPPDAVDVLTALTTLGTTDIALPDLAAALGTGQPAVTAALTALHREGWIETDSTGGPRLAESAWIWLVYDTPDRPDISQTAPIAQRYLAYHYDKLHQPQAIEWARTHRAAIIRAITAGVQTGQPAMAAHLARAAWAVAGHVNDPAWWKELASHGERAAIEAREPLTLIELLKASAAVYLESGDRPSAQVQLVRVAALAFEMNANDLIITSLHALLDLYRRWRHAGDAVDVLLELADQHHNVGNTLGRAGALAELGDIMLAHGRPATADIYLHRVDQLLSDQPAGTVSPTIHARVLEQRGRAEWQLRRPIRARRRLARALALVADHHPAASRRIQHLLDIPIDAADLPPDNDRPDGAFRAAQWYAAQSHDRRHQTHAIGVQTAAMSSTCEATR